MQKAIFVIDDDELVLRSLRGLLESAGFEVESFSSAADFLSRGGPGKMGCLVLDVRMPGMSGLELHQHMKDSGCELPTIFISAFDTQEIREQIASSGAIGFLPKPFDDNALLDAIELALQTVIKG